MRAIRHATPVKGVATHMLRNTSLDHVFMLMADQLENPMGKKKPQTNPVAGYGIRYLQYQHVREPGDYPDFKASLGYTVSFRPV